MALTENPVTFLDFYTAVLNKARLDATDSTTISHVKRMVNTTMHEMVVGIEEKLPWMLRRADLLTQPRYTDGTVAVTQGSTTVTGTGTLWDTANVFGNNNARKNGRMEIGGRREIYTVSSVTDDTTLELTQPFIGETDTGLGYTYFEDTYDLVSDFDKMTQAVSFDLAGEVRLIGHDEFRRRFPRNNVTGRPRIATIIDLPSDGDTTRIRRVEFHRPPDRAYIFPYRYVTDKLCTSTTGVLQDNMSADTDEPILPQKWRNGIVLGSLAKAYKDKKNDDRFASTNSQYVDIVNRMMSDVQVGEPKPRLVPMSIEYALKAERPWSGRGRRYTIGTAFDEFRDRW